MICKEKKKLFFVIQYKQILSTFTSFDDTSKISLCYSFSNKKYFI